MIYEIISDNIKISLQLFCPFLLRSIYKYYIYYISVCCCVSSITNCFYHTFFF